MTMIKIPPGTQYQTRANTQAAVSAKTATTQSGNASDPPNGAQNSKGKTTEPDKELMTGSTKQRPTALQIVARGIKNIIADDKLERKIKAALEGILKFIRDKEEKEKKMVEGVLAQPVVSTLHKVIKQELSKVYEALAKQMDGVLVSPSGHGVASFPNWVLYSHAGPDGTAEDLLSQTTKSSDHVEGQVI